MSRFVALEWDSREARIAVATVRAGTVDLEQVFAMPLPADADAAARGEALGEALRARRVGKAAALVAISRSNVELKRLVLPPAPDEELPEMVRFQAMRDFHSLSENWRLDFVPLKDATDGGRPVVAAAASPAVISEIEATCEAAGLELERITLRPYPAASLFNRHSEQQEDDGTSLLVDLSSDEVDLTVLAGDEVGVLRTTRLPADMLATPEQCRSLISEVRRTMAASAQQLGGRRVKSVTLCGTRAEHEELARRLEADLSVPVRLFDPFAKIKSGARIEMPSRPGRFAPLLGLLVDEAESSHAMDFLHPRRPPAVKKQTRPAVRIGVLVGIIVLLCGAGVWTYFNQIDNEITEIEARTKALARKQGPAEQQIAVATEIATWESNSVVWLDELKRLSEAFPGPKDAMLSRLDMRVVANAPPRINLTGVVRDQDVIPALESRLRDGQHQVQGQGRGALAKPESGYEYQFKSDVVILPEQPPAPQPAIASGRRRNNES